MADVENNNTEKAESRAGESSAAAAEASANSAFSAEAWTTPTLETKAKNQADAYPSDTARGDAYPSDTARGDAHPSDTARGDAYPTGDKGLEKEAGNKDAGKDRYDPYFQNGDMMQSVLPPLDVNQGDKPTEIVGGDRYTYDENGVETYENAGGGRIVTNPDGTFTVGGDVISMTQNKRGSEHTIIFADGSRAYLSGGRIRAVSSERDNQNTTSSRFRQIYRSSYK